MKNLSASLIILTATSLSFGIQFSKDTINAMDSNSSVNLINNENNDITIDTIKFVLNPNIIQYFQQGILAIDTVPFSHRHSSTPAHYLIKLNGTNAICYNAPAYYNFYIDTILTKDTLKLKSIYILDGPGIIPEYRYYDVIDTITMHFISSNHNIDSIVAIVNMEYGTSVKHFIKKTGNAIKSHGLKECFILNGRKINVQANYNSNNIMINKSISP